MDVVTRVLRHESELGRWELLLRPPDPRLSAFVGEYQGYVESVPHGPLRRQQVPTARLPLILNLGSRWSVADSPDHRARASRQLLRRALRPLRFRRRGRTCGVRPGRLHAARGAHVPRRPDARAREPRARAGGRPAATGAGAPCTARGEAVLGGALRPPGRGVRRRPRRCSNARGRRRMGLERARADARPGADRLDLRSAGQEPQIPRHAIPRADRPPAEDGRPDPPLRPRVRTARARRRAVSRSLPSSAATTTRRT